MEVKTVGVASDHAGFPLKQFVLQYLRRKAIPSRIMAHGAMLLLTIQTMAMP